ncbi:MAG: hypothetical protein JWO89_1299 [Verrucomicrobiaceae bacterium]|nr:hypothetical protein [Verrucomicrobiaceae bacterium]
MQVSWIDPDEVRDLLKQLEGPKQSTAASAWEVHTLPAPQVPPPAFDSLISDGTEPQPQAPDTHLPDPPLAESRPAGPANAELWRIRERLRVLRDKAQTAGILSRTRQEPVVPPAGGETPSPSSEPEAASPPPVLSEPQVEAAPLAEATAAAALSSVVETVPDLTTPTAPAMAEEEHVASPSQVSEVPPPPLAAVAGASPFGIAESPPPVYEPLFSSAPPMISVAATSEAAESERAPSPSSGTGADLPFAVSNQGLSDRLNAVAEWVCNRLGTREVLLVDDYGDVLWGAQGQTALVLSAMMAWHSAQRASASATCIDPERIDRPLAQGRALTVLPLRTRYGVVSLAVIYDQPIGEGDAIAIRRALAIAVEGTTSTGSNEAA